MGKYVFAFKEGKNNKEHNTVFDYRQYNTLSTKRRRKKEQNKQKHAALLCCTDPSHVSTLKRCFLPPIMVKKILC